MSGVLTQGSAVVWLTDRDLENHGVVMEIGPDGISVARADAMQTGMKSYDDEGAVYGRDEHNVKLTDASPFSLLNALSCGHGVYVLSDPKDRIVFPARQG